jgi:phosphate transport system substrate-binding protein
VQSTHTSETISHSRLQVLSKCCASVKNFFVALFFDSCRMVLDKLCHSTIIETWNRSMRKLWMSLPCLLAFVNVCRASDPVLLTGAGSTFIHPILSKWSKEYRLLHPGIEIYYEAIGSGKGISRTLAGLVDFGGADGPASDQQLEHARVKVFHIPVTIGAVVPAYNLPGVKEDIRFTGAALAGIFMGRIKKWDDPILVRANPNVRLPDKEIYVVSRLDSSGTTYIWTDYLSKVSPEWNKQLGRGTQVLFPVGNGTQFNEGVVASIKQNPYSIGYLQTTYAIDNQIAFGLVENVTGVFAKASVAGITAAAATVTNMPTDFRVSITNATGTDAYPVSSFTWLLVPSKIDDPAKKQALAGFLRWILTEGQTMATPLHYAPLPLDVAVKALHAVDQIQ